LLDIAVRLMRRDYGMFEARAHGRFCFVKVAAREFPFEGRGADGDASSSTAAPDGLLVIWSLSAKIGAGQESRNKAPQRVSSEREAIRGPRWEDETCFNNLPQVEITS